MRIPRTSFQSVARPPQFQLEFGLKEFDIRGGENMSPFTWDSCTIMRGRIYLSGQAPTTQRLEVDPLDNLYNLAVRQRDTKKFQARLQDAERVSDQIFEFDEMTRAMMEPVRHEVAQKEL
jgi:hypothetical protein